MKERTEIRPLVDGSAKHLHVALVVSVYHETITSALVNGAVAALEEQGASGEQVAIIRVPGAFELPFAARQAGETGRFDAVVCLGCIIRGETPHFDYIASAVAHGITNASQATGVPMTFGVLTTNSYDEALDRAGVDDDNKGREAALAALQLTSIVRKLSLDSRDG